MSILTFLILVPILASIAIAAGAPARRIAWSAALLNLLLCAYAVFAYAESAGGFQLIQKIAVIPSLDLKFFVGVDGLSLLLIALTTIVTLAAIWISPNIEKNARAFFICLLLISAGALGAFASLDLFFFYLFHELALIPTFLLIGIWGSGNRIFVAWKITIYLAIGSFVLLLGLILLYLLPAVGERTFDIPKLYALAANHHFHGPLANTTALLLIIGFGILISLFPFHTWAPDAYASAPAPAAMLHAGVLKKFGLYGLLRVALPILPAPMQHWTNLLLILLVCNILYVGFATIAQKQLDKMLGYSSVMHMGYIFLGIASFNAIGIAGAALLMVAHGLSIAALFAVSGKIRERTGTLEFSKLGGLAKPMPFLGFTFGLAAFAAIGLPGFANFAGEIMIFFGAFKAANHQLAHTQIAIVCALWGVVISAVYMLRAYSAVFMGEADARWRLLTDLPHALRGAIIILLLALLVAGFYPQPFIHLLKPTADFISQTGSR